MSQFTVHIVITLPQIYCWGIQNNSLCIKSQIVLKDELDLYWMLFSYRNAKLPKLYGFCFHHLTLFTNC